MAGPGKKRAQAEKSTGDSSDHQKSSCNSGRQSEQRSSPQSAQRSSPQSLPRFDGNRDMQTVPSRAFAPAEYSNLRNLSDALGMMGWAVARGLDLPNSLPPRPKGANKLGREINMTLNTYNLKGLPTKAAYQYDITIGGGNEKRGLVRKVWASKTVKAALGNTFWLFDGNKLAWSSVKLPRPETRIEVDLDKEEGRTPKAGKEGKNTWKIYIRFTKNMDFAGLQLFLDGKAPWTANCIDTINFFDHVLREYPSQNYTSIKKSFYQRGEQRFSLGKGIEAFKGVFSSLRPTFFANGARGLSVNVDVANGTFWVAQDLGKALMDAFGARSPAEIVQKFDQAVNGRDGWDRSLFKRDLKRFARLHVVDTHRKDRVTNWCIDKFIAQDCTQKKFKLPDGTYTTIFDYFKKQYSISLMRGIPLVKMTKPDCYLPVDVLRIEPNQRYNSKLDEQQTSQMIRFAVTYPKDRWAAVESGVKLLNWPNDPYLAHYNVQINTTPVEVKARILPCPDIQMAGGQIKAGTGPAKGRWRIDRLKFLLPNREPLRVWGVCVITGPRGSIQPEQAKKFVQLLVTTYKGHGGRFAPGGEDPWIGPGNLARGGEMISDVWTATGNKFQAKPQLLVWIVNDKNIDVYRRIKKSCDCRYGIVSQVLQSAQVAKLDSQYCSNVCMKINAKLGGVTSNAVGSALARVAPKFAATPTMCVGADVSHPAPGGVSLESASFAAITVSQDLKFGRYSAGCDTNGHRVEMITTRNIDLHFKAQATAWIQNAGKGAAPIRILYVRDGVSEGQYQQVLDQEVKDMKAVMRELAPKANPKFTVVIAGKRHHIRFFPKAGTGDPKTGNALPGTLVETGCTHPFEWDFYLCAHAAIKGTARPIHYQVILNEGNWGGEELQQFIFEQSFQYTRSTTPVSLFPAVYYAHLAADRARAHENVSPVSSGKKETKPGEKTDSASQTSGSSKPSTEANPLIAMNTSNGIQNVMWFI